MVKLPSCRTSSSAIRLKTTVKQKAYTKTHSPDEAAHLQDVLQCDGITQQAQQTASAAALTHGLLVAID
jgi:hypothetical protein